MDSRGGKDRLRIQLIRGVGLLLTVVGMLTVGILGPDAFTLETVVTAITALGSASQSASPAPLLAAGLLVGGLLLAVQAEFGPFGRIDSTLENRASCRICDHQIDDSCTECPYCRTSDPVEE
jgi:hypothetical protein